MRFFEFKITERKSADLYHNSNDGDKILKSGQINISMPDKDIMDEPTEREKEIGPRISLTRDFHYDWAPHKFVIDQAKLASRQKIIPIDTENPTYDERRVESEEYVLKPIALDIVKAVILPDIEKGYANNLEVAKIALDKGIDVFVGKHPRKLTPVTKEDLGDAPPKNAVAVITDPGFTPFEKGQFLDKVELDSAYDEYEDDFEFDMLENFAEDKEIGIHRSAEDFAVIDLSKSADGTFWLNGVDNTDWDSTVTTGQGVDIAFEISPQAKLASYDDIDKYSVDELENMGYDGVRMVDGENVAYQIWNTKILKRIKLGENFADGKRKGKSRPGRFKKAGVSCKGSVTSLRKKAKNASGEKQKGYHWCANMKSGRKKK